MYSGLNAKKKKQDMHDRKRQDKQDMIIFKIRQKSVFKRTQKTYIFLRDIRVLFEKALSTNLKKQDSL